MPTENALNQPAPSILAAIDELKRVEAAKPNGLDQASPFVETNPEAGPDVDRARTWSRGIARALDIGLAGVPVALLWTVLQGGPAGSPIEQGALFVGYWLASAAGLGALAVAGHALVIRYRRNSK